MHVDLQVSAIWCCQCRGIPIQLGYCVCQESVAQLQDVGLQEALHAAIKVKAEHMLTNACRLTGECNMVLPMQWFTYPIGLLCLSKKTGHNPRLVSRRCFMLPSKWRLSICLPMHVDLQVSAIGKTEGDSDLDHSNPDPQLKSARTVKSWICIWTGNDSTQLNALC